MSADQRRRRRSLLLETLDRRECLAANLSSINVNDTDPFTSITEIAGAGQYIYFLASSKNVSSGLWRTDGTDAGTLKLASVGSYPNLTSQNGQLYFVGRTPQSGTELWRTDGTLAGTVMIKDITPGAANSTIGNITAHNNQIFFTVRGELYRSDGTAAGTDKVIDLIGQSDAVTNVVSTDTALYFTSINALGKHDLYKTDGTAAGTERIVSVPPSIRFSQMTSVGSQLYFTSPGTLWQLDQATGQASSFGIPATELTNVSGKLFFADRNRLYVTDGSASGPQNIAVCYGNISNLTNFQGKLYFAGVSNVEGLPDTELWSSDGTVGGTLLLKDIDPAVDINYETGYVKIGSSNPHGFRAFNGQLAFITSSNFGNERNPNTGLWTTDGTAAGTQRLEQGPFAALATSDTSLGIVRSPGSDSAYSRLLLRTGSGASKEVNPPGPGGGFSSPVPFEMNGQLYVFADDGHVGRELFRVNADNSLTLVADITPGTRSTEFKNMTSANGLLYFTARDPDLYTSTYEALYRSDGTAAGTFKLMQLLRGADLRMVPFGNSLFFSANSAGNGDELFKTDGTVAGTVLVKDIDPRYYASHAGFDAYDSSPRYIRNFNGQLYFAAAFGERELWKSDGTNAGTQVAVGGLSGSVNITDTSAVAVFNGRVIFGGKVGTSWRLFAGDGTVAGTKQLATGFDSITQMVEANGYLYFVGTTAAAGAELWKLPPVGAPTLVKNIHPTGSSSPTQLTNANGKLYFTANDGTHGVELWQSDGTAAGTVQVRDGVPGSASSNPIIQGSLNGVLFYTANDDGTTGRELWQTNGSVSGARLAKDVNPGPGDSDPAKMLVRGDEILFSAYKPDIGVELFRLKAAKPVMTLPTIAAKSFTQNGPVRLAPQGLLDDPDTSIFWGAKLTVSLGTSYRTGDQVIVAPTSTVSIVQSKVLVNGTAVGVFTSSNAGRDLNVMFTQAATRAVVREVIRAIAFNNTSASPFVGQRIVRFDLTDGEGAIANHRAVRINVEAPPAATSTSSTSNAVAAAQAMMPDVNGEWTDVQRKSKARLIT